MSPKVSETYKQEKKKELLQAGKRVFINKGYANTTMQDVMDEAGVSRGALYAYFDHIDHVFIEVLQLEDQEDILFFKPDGKSPLWNQLTTWLNLQKKNIEEINESLVRAKAEFFLTSKYARQNESSSYIADRYDNLKDSIIRFIQSGVEKGEFQPQLSPVNIALYFISFMDGLMLNTFQLTSEKTRVREQLLAFQFSLENILRPAKAQ